MNIRKLSKRLSRLFLVLSLLITSVVAAPMLAANSPINIVINGQTLSSAVQPIIVNDRILVPMRAIFEALGADVTWDPVLQEVTGQREHAVVVLQINNPLGVINGNVVELDAAPMIYHDRTMVPVRFVAESLGETVHWDSLCNTVFIGGESLIKEEQAITRVMQAAHLDDGVEYIIAGEEFRNDTPYYVIKAFVSVDDGSGYGHTSAVGWYYVDKYRGSVYEWDLINDTLNLLG